MPCQKDQNDVPCSWLSRVVCSVLPSAPACESTKARAVVSSARLQHCLSSRGFCKRASLCWDFPQIHAIRLVCLRKKCMFADRLRGHRRLGDTRARAWVGLARGTSGGRLVTRLLARGRPMRPAPLESCRSRRGRVCMRARRLASVHLETMPSA